MLTLKYEDTKALEFYGKIKNKVFPKYTKGKNSRVYNVDEEKSEAISKLKLTKEEIKEIIISKPEELVKINQDFLTKRIDNFDLEEYNAYTKSEEAEKLFCTKYHETIVAIKKVFNYGNYVSNDYCLAELLDVHTCIYCNRNYVITVGTTEKKTLRAEYDHFYNKSKYPLLALSFYNLIPICGTCNKKKLDKDFRLDTHLHPYLINKEEKKFIFSFRKKNFIENNVEIKISTKSDEAKKKIEKTFQDLNIKEIYNVHSNKELRDLLDLRLKYSENYIDTLINKTFKGTMSKEEIYRMVFGIETIEEDYHKRPFSKFKHDIIEELKNIK